MPFKILHKMVNFAKANETIFILNRYHIKKTGLLVSVTPSMLISSNGTVRFTSKPFAFPIIFAILR